MGAIVSLLLSFLPLLLKLIGPLIAAWFAKSGHEMLLSSPDATSQHVYQLLGGWGAIGVTSYGLGEWASHALRRSAATTAGSLDVEPLKRIIALILELIQILLPQHAAAIHAAVAKSFPHEAGHLGINAGRAA